MEQAEQDLVDISSFLPRDGVIPIGQLNLTVLVGPPRMFVESTETNVGRCTKQKLREGR